MGLTQNHPRTLVAVVEPVTRNPPREMSGAERAVIALSWPRRCWSEGLLGVTDPKECGR
jgi:hypothetical protein